jgi:DNA-binding LacI/PurR family transcriptional regulator
VMNGVSTVANARDTKLLISTSSDESHGLAAYERVMRSQSADGAIVTSAAIDDPTVERLVASRLPIVLIGNFPYIPNAVTVGVNDVVASSFVTSHLIEAHNRKRLLHVAGPLDHQTGIDRREGFTEAVRSHRLANLSRVVEGDLSEISGYRAIAALGDEVRDFDGIVFANDDMAYGGLQALQARGVDVPSDVSLVGFDDFGLSRVTTPSISTVRVPAERMGRLAAERLFDSIAGSSVEWTRQEVGVSFVPRQSCGCQVQRHSGADTAVVGDDLLEDDAIEITRTAVRDLAGL